MKGGSNNAQIDEQKRQAEESRRREALRAQRIDQGTSRINEIFGEFGDPFYSGFRDANLGYYEPQVEDQYDTAREDTIYNLFRAGLGRSSVGNEALADLEKQKSLATADIRSKADTATGDLRQRVEREKEGSLDNLYMTEDPDVAASSALGQARAIRDTSPEYSPLGDLFKLMNLGAGAFRSGADNAAYGTNSASGLPGSTGRTYSFR